MKKHAMPGFVLGLLLAACALALLIPSSYSSAAAQPPPVTTDVVVYMPLFKNADRPTRRPTPTLTATATHTPPHTATATATRTATASATVVGGSTATRTATATRTPTRTAMPSATPGVPPPPGSGLVADHTSAGSFELIPDSALPAAIARKVLYVHASVGDAISYNGLNTLQGTKSGSTYPDYKYDRRNWSWPLWNPAQTTARDKVNNFVALIGSQAANYDVMGMKFCYIDTFQNDWTYYRDAMLQLEANHPSKTFIWSTQPVIPDWSVGGPGMCETIQNFNTNLRTYARANGKVLYDIADIESHRVDGSACFTGCETMCTDYGTGGHPNATGTLRLAKGFWWLMARISGWNPN